MIDEKKLIAELEEWRKALVLNAGIYGEGIEAIIDVAIQKVRSQPEVSGWIPAEERLPEDDRYILLSFENFDLPLNGRHDTDADGSGAFYLGDCDEGDTCIANDLYVNAWMPLPDPYRPEKLKEAGSSAADHADQDTMPELAKEHLMQRFTKVM